jgi:ketosteroid isomerase-like protein
MVFTSLTSSLCLALLATSCSHAVDDERAIREQVANYTRALDSGDLDLAAHVWWATKDVSAITPMGHSHGWGEVKGMYQFFADNFTDRHLQARDIAAHLMGDTAWVEYNWHFDAKIKANGMEIHSDGRESEVFRKIDGGWRIVHIHYSGPAAGTSPGPGFQ